MSKCIFGTRRLCAPHSAHSLLYLWKPSCTQVSPAVVSLLSQGPMSRWARANELNFLTLSLHYKMLVYYREEVYTKHPSTTPFLAWWGAGVLSGNSIQKSHYLVQYTTWIGYEGFCKRPLRIASSSGLFCHVVIADGLSWLFSLE